MYDVIVCLSYPFSFRHDMISGFGEQQIICSQISSFAVRIKISFSGEAARLVNEHLATYAAQMRHTRDLLKEKLSALTSVTWLSGMLLIFDP